MFIHVAIFSQPYGVYTYKPAAYFPESFWQPGLRVLVPFGRSRDPYRLGFVVKITDQSDLPLGVKILPILWPVELKPVIKPDLLQLIADLEIRQGLLAGKIAAGFLPQAFRNPSLLLHYIEQSGSKTYPLADLAHLSFAEQKELAAAMLLGQAKVVPGPRKASLDEVYSINCEPPWPVRPLAKVQIAILEYLQTNGSANRQILGQNISGNLSQALQALLKNGHIMLGRGDGEIEEDNLALLPPKERPFSLNYEQIAAVEALSLDIEEKKFHAYLLYGITGSGKTAVYLEIAAKMLNLGRSVLLLVPEVALALKLLQDAKTIYPEISVKLFHGYQAPSYRENLWLEVSKEKASFIIGTRSALFLPVNNLGCIILDEEHDGSFKQDEGLVYHAKEIAWSRATNQQALLLLGSATPDVRTFYAAKHSLPMLRLTQRISGRDLPPMELINTREPLCMSDAVTLLAQKSLSALMETVRLGQQAVILINRRGYAPHLYCLDCGKTEHCPQCEIALTFHKARGRLVCHYCGYSKPYPSPCSNCGSASFLPMGEGTERLAEELSTFFGQPVLRLDRDSTVRPGQMENILKAFANQEAQILVGTQMLSKGHHFPKVTLVIAADCDLGLNFPDYRACERTFQLLIQSAGRAGRGELPGQVFLQTRDVNHYCFHYVLNNDYEGFYENEIARRAKYEYPPFVNLALVRISYEREATKAQDELKRFGLLMNTLANEHNVKMLGPATAPLAMLRNRLRFQILLKAKSWADIRAIYKLALTQAKTKYLRLTLDLDPMNML